MQVKEIPKDEVELKKWGIEVAGALRGLKIFVGALVQLHT